VRSTVARSHAAEVLRSGDLLLEVAGRPVTCYGDVEEALLASGGGGGGFAADGSPSDGADGVATAARDAADGRPEKRARKASSSSAAVAAAAEAAPDGAEAAAASAAGPALPLTIFRGGAVLPAAVRLGREDGIGTRRLVHFCGAQLQAPHRAVRELGFLPEGASGVFVSRWHHGSPAHRYGLYALHMLLELNGQATPDLDTLLRVAAPLQARAETTAAPLAAPTPIPTAAAPPHAARCARPRRVPSHSLTHHSPKPAIPPQNPAWKMPKNDDGNNNRTARLCASRSSTWRRPPPRC